jgi:hypothetical protein
VGTTDSGEQLVGADGAHALRRVGQLERAGDDPDAADDEAGASPNHSFTPEPRRASLRSG